MAQFDNSEFNDSFDPDKLFLSKQQIIEVGDKLIARWKLNEPANRKIIWITKAAQWFARRYSEKEIEMYYKEFMNEVFQIMLLNARKANPNLQILDQVAQARAAEDFEREKRRLLALQQQQQQQQQVQAQAQIKKPSRLDFTKSLTYGGMKNQT